MLPGAAFVPEGHMNDDPCCYLCRSAFGPCLTQYRCEHHIKAERQANADARRPIRDPTGNTAVNNVMRQKRRQERK